MSSKNKRARDRLGASPQTPDQEKGTFKPPSKLKVLDGLGRKMRLSSKIEAVMVWAPRKRHFQADREVTGDGWPLYLLEATASSKYSFYKLNSVNII
jgi:hypothetical protein